MSKIYDLASEKVRARVDALLEKFYPQMKTAGLRVDLLWASTEDDEGDAVTLGGYSCYAVVRITSGKERAAGRGDAEITIDKKKYEEMTEAEADALLDHELYHLSLKTDRHGGLIYDAHERPVLKMRQHDHQFGWFNEIAKRHGESSFEVRQANGFRKCSGQQHFGWDLGGKATASKVTA